MENGGFDKVIKCPTRISQLRNAKGWNGIGSPDLFCTCTTSRSAVYATPSFVGNIAPASEECYAGVIINHRYKEYLTYQLSKRLRKNAVYCLKFKYSRSAFAGQRVGELAINLHKEMNKNTATRRPMWQSRASVSITDRPGIWSCASFTFSSSGGERFITIGSFKNDLHQSSSEPASKNPKNIRIFNYGASAYYFFDDIELVRVRKGQSCQPCDSVEEILTAEPLAVSEEEVLIDTVKTFTRFQLSDLNFESNKSNILPSSLDELAELAEHLHAQPQLLLHIMGHTDDQGTPASNKALSEARAQAVGEYLTTKGVARERLSWQGFGETMPIDNNKTEEGRARNRRVEFLIRQGRTSEQAP